VSGLLCAEVIGGLKSSELPGRRLDLKGKPVARRRFCEGWMGGPESSELSAWLFGSVGKRGGRRLFCERLKGGSESSELSEGERSLDSDCCIMEGTGILMTPGYSSISFRAIPSLLVPCEMGC